MVYHCWWGSCCDDNIDRHRLCCHSCNKTCENRCKDDLATCKYRDDEFVADPNWDPIPNLVDTEIKEKRLSSRKKTKFNSYKEMKEYYGCTQDCNCKDCLESHNVGGQHCCYKFESNT